ncbi:unnamed protein product [Thlaspi arvense]|uniref:Uncharacterized protein n=1 Tax=Thlaspi arvense TaxID=13288 RepID=A0AAU9S6H1_THLAR|nr:unnamed protein product [Thlaspi arvense]
MQAENDAREGADFSAAKHCRMELLLQQSVGHAELAFKHCNLTHESLNSKQVADVSSLYSLTLLVITTSTIHGKLFLTA